MLPYLFIVECHLLDAFTTLRAFKAGCIEANPIARALGVKWLTILSILGYSAFYAFVPELRWLVWFGVVAEHAVAAWNTLQTFRAHQNV